MQAGVCGCVEGGWGGGVWGAGKHTERENGGAEVRPPPPPPLHHLALQQQQRQQRLTSRRRMELATPLASFRSENSVEWK